MADKTKSIKNATDKEIDQLILRLRKETELQRLVAELKRKSTPKDPLSGGYDYTYDHPAVSTEAPIESLYHNVDKVLSHYGVQGMKWGIRSKIGPDGLVIRRGSTSKESEDYKTSRQLKAKGSNNLSNKELQTVTQRMQLEKQMRELTVSDYTKGMDIVKTVLSVGTTMASIYALSTTPLGQAVKKSLIK